MRLSSEQIRAQTVDFLILFLKLNIQHLAFIIRPKAVSSYPYSAE